MKTIVLEKPGSFQLAETAVPGAPRPGEALVRVRRVGICGSDLHAFRGKQPFFSYPRIVGHELGVEVVALGGDVSHLAAGDRCAVEPYLHCGRCIACRRGKTNCCVALQVLGVHLDGGMRELMTVPAGKLHPSQRLSVDQLALIEMLTIGAHAVRRAELEEGECALVVGAGPIGLSVIRFAQLSGAKVLVLEIGQRRRQFCRQHLKVETCLDGKTDPVAELQALLHGDLPTTVFEATGNPNAMMGSVQYVANGGKLVFVSLVQGDLTFRDTELHRRELTLLRSRNSTGADFAWAIQMVEEGKIDLIPWITHRAPADRMVADFPSWLDPERGVIKAVVEF
ncbi:MAG: zinc-binding alcohol dehydrogenase family protein [candidate division NC10 bacterium]|nr:zinc-binding alcohol dehydrogenase family protein [candidate division NC10 bacterium]